MFTSDQRAKRKSCPIKRGYAQLATKAVASQSDWQREIAVDAHTCRQGQEVINSSTPQCTPTQHQLHVNSRPQRLMTHTLLSIWAPPASHDAQMVAHLGTLQRIMTHRLLPFWATWRERITHTFKTWVSAATTERFASNWIIFTCADCTRLLRIYNCRQPQLKKYTGNGVTMITIHLLS